LPNYATATDAFIAKRFKIFQPSAKTKALAKIARALSA
jgi:hypothetical protein